MRVGGSLGDHDLGYTDKLVFFGLNFPLGKRWELEPIVYLAETGSSEILAGRLEREDPDDDTVLQGFVSSFNEPLIVMPGVIVVTNASTEFEDAGGNKISAADFFAQLEVNSLVKAKGTEVSDASTTSIGLQACLQRGTDLPIHNFPGRRMRCMDVIVQAPRTRIYKNVTPRHAHKPLKLLA